MSAAICAAAVTRLDTPASIAIDASAQRGRHRHVRFVHLRAVRSQTGSAVAGARLEDPKQAGRRFFCRHGWLLEVALSGIDGVHGRLEMRRIGFPRPRREVIGLVGESDRSLPTLVTCSARCAGSAIAANHPSEGMAELRR
ncbi:DUF3088 family protein [Xanthomonas arboricola]|uniref:DUF3088 family protein n=1 Tax=Xanthomonas arboricola TaxID=56448 RepID=UPI001FD59FB4|nr:DUF3088 family protein [Xanthomonas arboricola]